MSFEDIGFAGKLPGFLQIRLEVQLFCINRFNPQPSERKGIVLIVPIPSECRESKVEHSAPWGRKGGKAFAFSGMT
ncbi:MAG: hypothetical protein CVV52_12660 [Spirochaetae bacterium HGW-Spirochaetae-8]|nr:MAG: hypothetical protein CVV52_12660 [Spirochaetae bacterium HGW-Spirochaetae-8]